MDSAVIAAIITAIAVVVAAVLKLRRKRERNVSMGNITSSRDVIISARDTTVVYPTSKNEISDNDKNLFTIGYLHGDFVTRIVCRLPTDTFSLNSELRFALDGLLDLVKYPSRARYLEELASTVGQADVAVLPNQKKVLINRMNELLSPLKLYIGDQHKGRGYASFVLGLNLPQLVRCLNIFRVIEDARRRGQSALVKQTEQLWDDVKDMLYDIHIDNLRNLVLFEDLPSDLKRSLNCILSSDIHRDRREMERELSSIGALYDAPFMKGK